MPAIAAAIIALAVSGPDMLLTMRSDHWTRTKVESIALQDGSHVALNAGSAIAVRYADNERRIELLRGDAWFDVAHDDPRPFRVVTLEGVTQDIGTAFEVQRHADSALVSVTQGAVQVSSRREAAGVLVKASQRVRYDKDGNVARMPAVTPAAIAPWRQGEILLEKMSADAAIATIARYRTAPVYILGHPDPKRRISGVFKVSETEEAIDAIARMSHLTVYRIGGIILLRPYS